MLRFALAIAGIVLAAGAGALEQAPAPDLSAAQIVERNVAARGGLEAWRRIQTMDWIGHITSARGGLPPMPFLLEQKRPNKTRFELTAMGEKSLRVFDGVDGWKIRPGHGGKPDIKRFTPAEAQFARDEQTIDGPLIDYQAKGNVIHLEGVEQVDGRSAYHLAVRLNSGGREDVWIDAQTFLDFRYDRRTFSPAGTSGAVTVQYRNFQAVDGLQIPSVIEIGVGSGKTPDRMEIERVALNPRLDDRLFARPGPRRALASAPAAAPAATAPR